MANSPATQAAHVRGTLALTGASVDHLVTRVHEWHRAIADIPFKIMKPIPGVKEGSEPARVIHDTITDGIYSAVRGISNAVFKGAEVVLKTAEQQGLTPTAAAPAHRVRDDAIAAISGAVGDYMSKQRNPLSIRAGFYKDGQRLTLTPDALRAAYPQTSPKVAVFIHGLCSNESVWKMFADADNAPYDERIPTELGYTALHVRYNSGLHISQNGLNVARQLRKLVAAYPVKISEIVFIGHSMGGLVSRSACHYGHQHQMAWTAKVKHVICLGSPHRGAGLERVTHAATGMMENFSLTRPLARLLDSRSKGILDLRYGYVSDADWRGRHFKTQYDAYLNPIARLSHAGYHFIGGSLGRSASDPVEKYLGDGLVTIPSSTAAEVAGGDVDADTVPARRAVGAGGVHAPAHPRQVGVPTPAPAPASLREDTVSRVHTAVLFKTHHLKLLNHPVVYQWLVERLTGQRQLA